jgi:hypothetical protein
VSLGLDVRACWLPSVDGLLPLNALVGSFVDVTWCDNYLRLSTEASFWEPAYNRLRTTLDNLTSNQVGLPAELKHINKRRKRN